MRLEDLTIASPCPASPRAMAWDATKALVAVLVVSISLSVAASGREKATEGSFVKARDSAESFLIGHLPGWMISDSWSMTVGEPLDFSIPSEPLTIGRQCRDAYAHVQLSINVTK